MTRTPLGYQHHRLPSQKDYSKNHLHHGPTTPNPLCSPPATLRKMPLNTKSLIGLSLCDRPSPMGPTLFPTHHSPFVLTDKLPKGHDRPPQQGTQPAPNHVCHQGVTQLTPACQDHFSTIQLGVLLYIHNPVSRPLVLSTDHHPCLRPNSNTTSLQ